MPYQSVYQSSVPVFPLLWKTPPDTWTDFGAGLRPQPGGGPLPFSGYKTMVSDLEVLILLPAASRSAANCSSKSCWWRSVKTSRTKSAKSSDLILMSLKLCLEILSINVKKRIHDKGQPWLSLTLTWKKSGNLNQALTPVKTSHTQ